MILLWICFFTLFFLLGESSPLSDCLGPLISSFLTEAGDEEYEFLSTGWMARIDREPTGILQIQKVSDLTIAILCAKELSISAVPRSGKHSYEDASSQTGQLVLDLGALNSVSILEGNTARFEPGATLGKVYTILWEEAQSTFPAGMCPNVGVGGHLVGGGSGMTMRTYGLASGKNHYHFNNFNFNNLNLNNNNNNNNHNHNHNPQPPPPQPPQKQQQQQQQKQKQLTTPVNS